MDDPRAASLVKRYSTLQTQRSSWESHWQEIADYIVPRKADITKKRTSGDKRSELIFDGTAIHAAELMAASLHGMLTNAATPWFSLRYEENELNGDDESKEWLEGATDVMYQHLARSNFQEQIHELYSDLVTFGTGTSRSATCLKMRMGASILYSENTKRLRAQRCGNSVSNRSRNELTR